ncbi:hypothetical protein [Sinosporangium siamense]|uniref:hypothetical protein n=1 Tax=Sinosporangium siamense TaxID=1367973 RepID=UPI001EF193E3|nr:hypothetical protein [Sinosporangium siamense]
MVLVVLVVAALVLLSALGAPRVMVACVAVMLATLAVIGPVTLVWKISFHTAVAAGSVVTVANVAATVPVLLVGAVLVGLIGWSRVSVGDHTAAQVVAGTAAGGVAAWGTLAVLL